MKTISYFFITFLAGSIIAITGCGPKYTIQELEGYTLAINRGGLTLGFSANSGVTIIEEKGFAFKDLNKNGVLDRYEDWRLPVDERARDLVKKMTVEQQHEDVPRDMTCFTDSEGNTYEFAFGLNWSGVIDDSRVSSYR